MIGKQIRMERIIDRNSGKTVMIPMDHGITLGPIPGLIDMKQTVDSVASGGANAIIIHKGLVAAGHRGKGRDIGLIIHLSASTALAPDPNSKVLVCGVEEAIKLGADAVSIHVNVGANHEKEMLKDFGMVAQKAAEWGFPLVAMVYPRGVKIKDEYDPKVVKHAARLGAELGADMVKVNYTGKPETFREVVEGCFIPVVIAGGPKMEGDRDILEMVKGAMEAGAGGASIGRNAFQHRNPTRIVKAISLIVHENASVDEALAILGGER